MTQRMSATVAAGVEEMLRLHVGEGRLGRGLRVIAPLRDKN